MQGGSRRSDEGTTLFNIAVTFAVVVLSVFSLLGFIGFIMELGTARHLKEHNYSLYCNGASVFEGTGDTNAIGRGYLTIDLKTKLMTYNIAFSNIGEITDLTLKGPVTGDDAGVGDQYLPSTAGDTLELEEQTDGTWEGELKITEAEAKLLISNPGLYYLLLTTDDKPLGSVACPLGREFRAP